MDIWTAEKLPLFLVFIVPGFVSLKVWDLLVPGERRGLDNSLIDLVAYKRAELRGTGLADRSASREATQPDSLLSHGRRRISGIPGFVAGFLELVAYPAMVAPICNASNGSTLGLRFFQTRASLGHRSSKGRQRNRWPL